MISVTDVDRLSEGWIREFSVDPYVVKQRKMTFWHELDDLIYKAPLDAILVFDAIAKKNPINWTFEGLAIGPLRTFLMTHDAKFDRELSDIRLENKNLDEMYLMALEGL